MISIYKRISNKDVEFIRKSYINGKTINNIRKIYPFISERTITKIIRDGNIEIRPAKRYTKIEHEDFFETIDSEEKAYILGLLLSDGYIIYPNRKGRSPQWGITLQEKDSYILEAIKKSIGTNKKITTRNHNNSIEYYLILTSSKMVNDLSKYGIVKQKSKTIRLPKIDNQYMHHLIRGIFDGDGCVYKNVCSFCGNKNIVEDIKNFLVSTINLSDNKLSNRKNSLINSKYMDVYAYCFSSKKDREMFYNYIYKDASIYLKRKEEKLRLSLIC